MEVLYGISHWVIAVVFALALAFSAEVGWRVGKRMAPNVDDDDRSQFSSIEAAVLGLLGLFLAFTFAAAADRFDARRLLVVKEANAIGTAFLRTELLPEPTRAEAQALLRRYVDARLEFYEARVDEARVRAAIAAGDALERALWSIAIEEARKDARSVTMGLLLQSLNDVIDVDEERVIAMESHVPEFILVLLMIVGCAGLGTVGTSFGLLGRRRRLATLMLSVLVASILFVIMDLDRPRRGLVLVSQQSMRNLQESLATDQP